jgi:hypothetical protein
LKERERKSIEKRKEKRKALRVSANKKGKLIFWEEKNIATSKSFYEPIFFPSIILFQKPLPKLFEKISQLFLDHPLTWQYPWLELYPLSLPMSSTYWAFRG